MWSAGGRDGYLRMIDLVELLIAEAEDRVGMTLAETIRGDSRGRIRAALYVGNRRAWCALACRPPADSLSTEDDLLH